MIEMNHLVLAEEVEIGDTIIQYEDDMEDSVDDEFLVDDMEMNSEYVSFYTEDERELHIPHGSHVRIID